MKTRITVNNKTYEVEIEDIHARPVVAVVDGERFEVMPEESAPKAAGLKADHHEETSPNPAPEGYVQTAPLPGTVVSVFVKAGDKVEAGQVLVVIEAMKMKNSIRSMFGGVVDEVLVGAGQSVAHKQALFKFGGAA